MKFAVIWSSIASRFDAFIPFASVATKATSATPIISAAAVAAVRPGLRIELRRASAPADPPIHRAGRPTTAASGRTSLDEIIATPTNRSSTPPAIDSSRSAVPRSSANIARPSRTSASAITTSAMYGVKRENRPFGSSAPSRTAAIGGTRVARIAGKSPAITVIKVPTSSETTIVRVAKTVSETGSPRPSARKRASSPFASARPRNRPTTEAMKPMTNASSRTDRSTCRREAPSVRSVANSRVRWATVIERVLKITNDPTKSAIPAKARRK